MGYSIQVFGNRAENFHDLDLIALTGLMSERVQEHPEKFCEVSPIVGGWVRDLAGYGPGAIDLKLDAVISSEPVAKGLETLLSEVADRIVSFGTAIPASFLNARCRAPGVIFANFPSASLLEALDRFRALVFPG
ncbi:MAG: hypothetical protein ABI134_33080 [Byssovorax sp.]